MTDINTILPNAVEGQEAFILDHGKVVDGALKYQDELTSYGWNIKQFNKMHVGAFVLNRHPGKITKDRKFEIYAGGYVESISDPDEDGNVTATITHAFNIVPPIKQGDSFIENFDWESKTKRPGSWEHFWNQYGMNTISYAEYEKIINNTHCIPAGDVTAEVVPDEPDITSEEVDELESTNANGFCVFEEDGPVHAQREKKYSGIARTIDFEKIQKAKNKTGALGEEIVLDILIKKAAAEGLKAPVHASKEEGDGLGYDIRSWDADGNEIHIEVKASRNKYADGFEMSYNEVMASKDDRYKYQIYRLYSLNSKTKECRLKIYDGPITEEGYKLVSTKIAVYKK
jgi:hypothetical protein